jgi:hypothetical protein
MDSHDGGHVVGVFGPARALLAVGLGNGSKSRSGTPLTVRDEPLHPCRPGCSYRQVRSRQQGSASPVPSGGGLNSGNANHLLILDIGTKVLSTTNGAGEWRLSRRGRRM